MPKYNKVLESNGVKMFFKDFILWAEMQDLDDLKRKCYLSMAFETVEAKRWFQLEHDSVRDSNISFSELCENFLTQAPMHDYKKTNILDILDRKPEPYELASSYLQRMRFEAGDSWQTMREGVIVQSLIKNLPTRLEDFLDVRDPKTFADLQKEVKVFEQKRDSRTMPEVMKSSSSDTVDTGIQVIEMTKNSDFHTKCTGIPPQPHKPKKYTRRRNVNPTLPVNKHPVFKPTYPKPPNLLHLLYQGSTKPKTISSSPNTLANAQPEPNASKPGRHHTNSNQRRDDIYKQGPTINILINGKVHEAVIDSGAACSIVSRDLAHGFQKLHNSSVALRSITNERIATSGFAIVEFEIGGSTINYPFAVVDREKTSIILGYDFLERFAAQLDSKNFMISSPAFGCVPLTTPRHDFTKRFNLDHFVAVRRTTHSNHKHGCCRSSNNSTRGQRPQPDSNKVTTEVPFQQAVSSARTSKSEAPYLFANLSTTHSMKSLHSTTVMSHSNSLPEISSCKYQKPCLHPYKRWDPTYRSQLAFEPFNCPPIWKTPETRNITPTDKARLKQTNVM